MSVEKKKTTPTKEQREAADPQRSVWVAASAGSGKTHVLVDRITRLLLDGAKPDSLLCLTFTKAAAGEMANRLFKRLGDWAGMNDADIKDALMRLGEKDVSAQKCADARRLFARALETPGGLKIQTIHAFCEQLLQRFPVESNMAPGFRVMETVEERDLFRRSLLETLASEDRFLQEAWSFMDQGDVLTLERLEKLAKAFLSASTGMRGRLSDMQRAAETADALQMRLDVPDPRPRVEIVDDLTRLDIVTLRKAHDALLPHEAFKNRRVFENLDAALKADETPVRLAALQKFLFTGDGNPRAQILKKSARDEAPRWTDVLEAERDRLTSLGQALALHDLHATNVEVYRAMSTVLARINIEKRAQGRYDFDDLIGRTARLLLNADSAQWVLKKLDTSIQHILVDEAQDTSPAQWNIIKAIAEAFFQERDATRTLFVVGDAKQSIYSFQGADVKAFSESRAYFKQQLERIEDELRATNLTTSYRSNQHILATVNAVFAPGQSAALLMGDSASDAADHAPDDRERSGLVELWDLEPHDEKEERDHWQAPVDTPPRNHPRRKLAFRLAQTIKNWIGKRKLTGRDRAVQAGDILILLQRRNSFFYALLGELGSLGIRVAGADRLQLQESLIVQDFLALIQFIRMPDDDLNLACLLKSPLMPEPFDEEAMMKLAMDRGAASLWSVLPAASANWQLLQTIAVSPMTPFNLFSNILQSAKAAIRSRLGDEALDAAHELMSRALEYEQERDTSLTGFADWFKSGDTEIKREMEQGGNALRVMTVHGSKGLEASIVILADAGDQQRARGEGLLRAAAEEPEDSLLLYRPETFMTPPILDELRQAEKQRETAERMRLLYVGMTRAADELYVCGVAKLPKKSGDESEHGESVWYPHVKRAFESGQLPDVRRVTREDGLGLYRFGAEPEQGGAALDEESDEVVDADWVPTSAKLRVPETTLTHSRRSENFDRQAIKRGLATHKLAEVMADVSADQRVSTGRRWAKRLGLDDTVVDRLVAAFDLPELAPFFGPEAQSEVAIEGQAAGEVISGRMDRMAVMPETIWLLDYKTDRHPPRTLDATHDYARQVGKYRALLAEAYPGRAIRAALLWTETGEVLWLADTLLSRALEPESA
jgi:ATP-dependent helicase/nuclease subunit A